MAVLSWSLTTVILGFLIHLALWRIRLPRYQTKTLLLIFVLTLIAVLASINFLNRPPLPLPSGLAEYCHISLFVIIFALCYIISYSAIEADSPTLVMIRAIAAKDGLPEEELRKQASDDVLIIPRVMDLVRDGMVVQEENVYRLTSKGKRFISIFIAFRNLLGAGKGG